ncbi:hypothetical protein QQS21_009973 [Conoideocrella luteorostrata]|uniref:WD40 repeat-like protein n=1 Tax=Conoideocrella luteorostrata TaxID=1105319 RepID=A0AAJ0CG70_9HYPO|nr:hypothetical protein QQS21_009973 [Conoideocrella luteorostrata]
MFSPSSSPTDQCCGNPLIPHQDEEDSLSRTSRARVISPSDDHYHHDGSNPHLPGAGVPVTGSSRNDAQAPTPTNPSHASHLSYQQPVSSQSSSRQLYYQELSVEDYDESMTDIEGGASLDKISSTTQTEDDYEDFDANHSVASHQPNDNGPIFTQPSNPYLNFNGPPNLPLQLLAIYGTAPMMDPEVYSAPWDGNPYPASGVGSIQEPASPPQYSFSPAYYQAANAFPPVQLSNPNPNIPGSENLGLVDFLRHWAYQESFRHDPRSYPPNLPEVLQQAGTAVTGVSYHELQADKCDFQALNWSAMNTTRSAARFRRCQTYKNYVNRPGSDLLNPRFDDESVPVSESFFRFRRMSIRQDVNLAHFQLRSVLACPTRTHAFYPCPMGINRINTVSHKTDCIMSIRDFPVMGGALSTLDAGCGVLMGGTFNGEYYIKSLDCNDETKFFGGQIASEFSGITNHVKIYQSRRSSKPVAAIASNDLNFRVMDIETEQYILQKKYHFAVNCSALSPDSRLRVVVGDSSNVLITNADTGEVLQTLPGHRDYGFACDWSQDGWAVATGYQDRGVKIWDARKWCNSSGMGEPLCTLRSEMASVRGLQFSPVGSGKPVLVAAEEADFINIIDAKTFGSKQTIDIFGEIGGVAFTNEGQDLNVLCCDMHRGGLLQLERCGRRPEPIMENLWSLNSQRFRHIAGHEDASFGRNSNGKRRPALADETLVPF